MVEVFTNCAFADLNQGKDQIIIDNLILKLAFDLANSEANCQSAQALTHEYFLVLFESIGGSEPSTKFLRIQTELHDCNYVF